MTSMISTHAASPTASSSSSSPHKPQPQSPLSPVPNQPSLPPLNTSPLAVRRSNLARPSSHARDRLSIYSTSSYRSKTQSQVFPVFHSTLAYALVRDFAFPLSHPLHYGPPPEQAGDTSGLSSPVSEHPRRLSDPARSTWDSSITGWSAGPWGGDGSVGASQDAPPAREDGPPWSEDDDLQSPVVVSSRHKKHKSSGGMLGLGSSKERSMSLDADAPFMSPEYYKDHGYYTGNDSADKHYDARNSRPADFERYASDRAPHATLAPYNVPGQRDSHFAATLPNRSYVDDSAPRDKRYGPEDASDTASSPGLEYDDDDESRYSRDYQFTIASPDEEMHGKAVALFDFARENENELPLVEGQVIWVSYRHGQGWLVAEDPKTQESGLVPEEYVRLLRDIHGGLGSLTGDPNDAGPLSPLPGDEHNTNPVPDDDTSPSTTDSPHAQGADPTAKHLSNGNQQQPHTSQAILSTFSTSSKDLDPYPTQHLLGAHQAPPQVVPHYQGQPGTPTREAHSPIEPTTGSGSARGRDTEGGSRPRKSALGDGANGAAAARDGPDEAVTPTDRTGNGPEGTALEAR